MLRGLMWLPLLAIFFGLAWAGWNEYQKLEAYKVWATQFERAKYDIYAALGQTGDRLVWGLPTRQGIIETQELSLADIQQIRIEVDQQTVDPEKIPKKGKVALGFDLSKNRQFTIPFTDREMTKQWYDFLHKSQNI
ncbi:MAG: hypothetical protein AAFQ63_09415 [Cyanobacteria bacterium J06621_11]